MRQLGEYQRYLIEEFVDDWREGHLSRRDLVKRTIYITGGTASAATVLLSLGCAPATPTAVPTKPPAPTAAPPPPTVAPPPPTASPKPTEAPKPAAEPTRPTVATTAPPAPTKPPPETVKATEAQKPAGSPAAAPAPTGPRSPLSVKEDDPAIEARKVEYTGEAGKLFGYLARPKAPGSYAGLIVIHENRGLTQHILDVTRRAAKEGYIALGVDLLSRAGGTDKIADPNAVGGLLSNQKPDDFVADLGAGVAFLQEQAGIKKEKIGVFGFCFGGGYSWRLAVSNKEIKAAAPFYGIAPPLELVPNTNAAILGIYAENDPRINASMGPLEDALKKAGKTYEMRVYPGVNHAFHNDTGANWNERTAVEAWTTVMVWFKKHLA